MIQLTSWQGHAKRQQKNLHHCCCSYSCYYDYHYHYHYHHHYHYYSYHYSNTYSYSYEYYNCYYCYFLLSLLLFLVLFSKPKLQSQASSSSCRISGRSDSSEPRRQAAKPAPGHSALRGFRVFGFSGFRIQGLQLEGFLRIGFGASHCSYYQVLPVLVASTASLCSARVFGLGIPVMDVLVVCRVC